MRDRRLELFGIVVLTLVGGFVWLTRHPGAPIVRRAERWPLVGAAATAFRARWDPAPPPSAPPTEAPIVEFHYILESDGPTAGRLAAPRRVDPAMEPRGSAGGPPRSTSLDASTGVAPVLPVPALPADPELLARATRLLAAGATEHRLGSYRLLADAGDAERIVRWRAIFEAAESAWRSRYGVVPVGSPAETIVLFARQAALRQLQGAEPRLGALDANGFTLDGLVALAVEGLSEAELDATLQHELAHLLTRRSLGPALPAWLAEGLAEEFGLAPLSADGFDFSDVRGSLTRDGNRYELRGGLAALDRLRRRAGRNELLSLAELASVNELEFSAGEAGIERYSAAFAWVRFLLAEPVRAGRFRAFLAAVANGQDPTLARLERALDVPLDDLAAPLRAWLVPECDRILRAAGVPRQRGDESLRDVPPSELPADPTRTGSHSSGRSDGTGSGSSSRQLELPSS